MPEIRVVNLKKYFGKVRAVDGISFDVNDGEFVALLGPSGCGKTTTLLTLAGIYKPTGGEIYFDDILMNDVPPKYREIGMVFQNYALYPHMNVFENIAFPLKAKKLPKEEITKKNSEKKKRRKVNVAGFLVGRCEIGQLIFDTRSLQRSLKSQVLSGNLCTR